VAEPGALCCYVKSDKHWVTDPQGIAWEAFHTLDSIPLFGSETEGEKVAGGCCSGKAMTSSKPGNVAAAANRCC